MTEVRHHGPATPRLLIVSDTLCGGTGAVVVRHAEWFRGAGWDVGVAAPAGEADAEAVAGHVPVAVPGSIRQVRGAAAAARALGAACRTVRPDVVHCHGARSFLLTRLVRRRAPFVTLHSISSVSSDPPGYFLLRRPGLAAVAALAAGAFSARPDAPRGWRFAPHASSRLGSLTLLPPPMAPQPTFLWIGRLDEPKRPDLFVAAVAAVAARVPAVRGIVAGTGPLAPAVLAQAEGLGAPVQFLGHVRDLGPLLRQAWAVALFSDAEAVNFALQEGMWSGRAVVGSRVAGIEWLVGSDGECGGLAASLDEAVDVMLRLCSTVAAAEAGGRAADRVRSLLRPEDPWPIVERAYEQGALGD